MESGAAADALAALRVARDRVAALDVDALTHTELLEVLDHLETDTRRTPVVAHRVINRLAAEANPLDLGATSLTKLLAFHLRIGHRDARRRIDTAADLGARRTLSGETLAPVLDKTAAAQRDGRIGADHLTIIRNFFTYLPDTIDQQTRAAAEADLARIAAEHGPEGLRKAANLLAALLHPDGNYTDDERARRRGITLDPQQSDGMSRLHGWLTPEGRATWEAVMAKSAAPGMCNPDDDHPTIDGPPTEQTTERDSRSPAQRNHDALLAMGRSVLSSGHLGHHSGLPATIIVTTTLQELESGAGQAITAGGTRLPMTDLIRLASHAFHYLAVFDKHTGQALHLGRTRRCASPAQRIMLLAKYRGCTKPGCLASGYDCQAHHAVNDWKHNGQTNIDDLTLACGPDNRLIENTNWITRQRQDGRTEWIPPPQIDTGQARTNNLHHPERMLYLEVNDDQRDEPA
ncbi:MAG: hypothetical protein QOD90_3497 [Mycobacterium sp.]|jgi:hypothetical protein|nr:hypothetical protein [Mycobacterium sp.]